MALKVIKKPVLSEEEREKEVLRKRGKASKVKGANYERKVAKIFKEKHNVDLVRTPQSGGFVKRSTKAKDFRGDITCLDDTKDFLLHIEAKNQKTIKIRDWLSQAQEDCPEDKIPLVVFHLNQLIKDNKVVSKSGDYVTLKLEDFLNLVDKNKIIKDKE